MPLLHEPKQPFNSLTNVHCSEASWKLGRQTSENSVIHYCRGEQRWHSGESARLPPMCPGFDYRTRRHMWVEFVVGSLHCSEKFFSGYSGFPLSSKTIISKFQFELDYCQALYHEPLARVIAQALPVFDVKFTFTWTAFTIVLLHISLEGKYNV